METVASLYGLAKALRSLALLEEYNEEHPKGFAKNIGFKQGSLGCGE